MSTKTCPNCQVPNPPNMAFCTNCGGSLASAAPNSGNAPNTNASDLPPTMVSFQPNLQANPAIPPITPSTQPPAPKKGNKGLIFGLIGCGALLILSVIGLVVGGVVLNMFNQNNKTNTNVYTNNSNVSNSNSSVNSNRNDSSGSSAMLAEFQKLKQIGVFRQTDAKNLKPTDYFPSATDAAQANYTNGSKEVISILGKFPSNQVAFDDFDAQIAGVKAGGGKIYTNEAKNGTKAAFYMHKGYYFIEACGDAVCSRNYSSDRDALSKFAVAFGNAVQ